MSANPSFDNDDDDDGSGGGGDGADISLTLLRVDCGLRDTAALAPPAVRVEAAPADLGFLEKS